MAEDFNIEFESNATAVKWIEQWSELEQYCDKQKCFIITDENVHLLYADQFKSWNTIVIPAGEKAKCWEVCDDVIRQLLALNAGRDCTILGVGGGVVGDVAGFIAGIYKRGVCYYGVPTSLLAKVDSAIGGKNGINIGDYKNMIGTVKQAHYLFYCIDFLDTLPEREWINGFAEIIKHAAIRDKDMFHLLEQHDIEYFRNNKQALQDLIYKNVQLKSRIVVQDPFEMNVRKLLNFGHTLGHAIEKAARLSHGKAIAIGMNFASVLSQQYTGFKDRVSLANLFQQYQLPIKFEGNKTLIYTLLIADKKRVDQDIDFVLLKELGVAQYQRIPLNDLKIALDSWI